MALFKKNDPYAAGPEMSDPPPMQPEQLGQGYYQDPNQPAAPPAQPPPQQPAFPPPQPMPAPSNNADSTERVEEIAEAIIDEKWNELIKEMNKVIEWKERTDTELKRVAQEIENLKERFESLHTGVLGKISEYDQNLTNVGTQIKAMDKVFQNVLPSFTENMNKLDRVTKKLDK